AEHGGPTLPLGVPPGNGIRRRWSAYRRRPPAGFWFLRPLGAAQTLQDAKPHGKSRNFQRQFRSAAGRGVVELFEPPFDRGDGVVDVASTGPRRPALILQASREPAQRLG